MKVHKNVIIGLSILVLALILLIVLVYWGDRLTAKKPPHKPEPPKRTEQMNEPVQEYKEESEVKDAVEAVPESEHVSESEIEVMESEVVGLDEKEVPIGEDIAVRATFTGPLRVNGAYLVDESGVPVQLRGVSTHGLSWYPEYVNRELFCQLHDDWNANVIRLAMYSDDYNGYCSGGNQETLKQLVKDGINYATEAGMYVIVDWHILPDGNPHTHKEAAKQFFEEISQEFAGADNVLYELCNEPNGGTTWQDIKSYAEEIIPIIRSNDEDAVIIVGTPTWSQEIDKAAADPITGYNNIMYSLHFYADTHGEWLRDRMRKAVNDGLPVFVTEFGTCDASGNTGLNIGESDKWIQAMDECGVSYVAWNLSNKAETSAIFKPECGKVHGFAEEDLTENGKWIFEMLAGEGAQFPEAAVEEPDELPKEQENIVEEPFTEPSAETESEMVVATDGELQCTATVTNSWESGGQTFYQYNLTIHNTSSSDVSMWKVTLNFNENITFSDGWNGDYKVDGNTLVITAKEYNGSIAGGGSVSDVGFIIAGSNELKLY